MIVESRSSRCSFSYLVGSGSEWHDVTLDFMISFSSSSSVIPEKHSSWGFSMRWMYGVSQYPQEADRSYSWSSCQTHRLNWCSDLCSGRGFTLVLSHSCITQFFHNSFTRELSGVITCIRYNWRKMFFTSDVDFDEAGPCFNVDVECYWGFFCLQDASAFCHLNFSCFKSLLNQGNLCHSIITLDTIGAC